MIDIDKLRELYPQGCRVELVRMDDNQAPPVGTKGTVVGVDDIGSILVNWDNGSSLNVVYGVDEVRKLETVKTICYGKERTWDSAKEAIIFFLRCLKSSEGSEKERCCIILMKLAGGEKVCSDELSLYIKDI